MITVFGTILMFVNKEKKDGSFTIKITPLFELQNANPENLEKPEYNFKLNVVVQNSSYVKSLPDEVQDRLFVQAEDEARRHFMNHLAKEVRPVYQ